MDPTASSDVPTSSEIGAAEPARGAISGRVSDAQGAPVVGASVCVYVSSGDIRDPRCTVTGTNGSYRVGELSAAKYEVNASAPQRAPVRWREEDGLRLKAGESRENVNLVLAFAGIEVRGRVVDITGGPVVGALVGLYSSSLETDGGRTFTRSGEQGEWLAWLPPGRLMVEASAEGYAQGSSGGVAPGQFIEVGLTPESVLEGRVVDASTGNPVAGARVAAQPSGDLAGFVMSGSSAHTAISDVEGRFRISQLAPGRYKAEGRTPHAWGVAAESVLLGLGETASELRIEVHPTATVSGRLVFDDGRGCHPASVQARETTTKDSHSGQTQEDGSVRIEGLLPGTYEIGAFCNGAWQNTAFEPLVVGKDDITGVTWKVIAGSTLRGALVDATGRPATAEYVSATAQTGNPRVRGVSETGKVERDGTFQIEGLAPGTYAIDIVRRSVVTKTQTVVKVDRDVDGVRVVVPQVAASATGTIEGTLVDADGTPVSGVDIEAQGNGSHGYGASVDDGSFVVKNLRPGDYRVWINGENGMRAPRTKDDDVQGATTTVRADAVSRVKLVVESRRGEIHGRVVDEGGHPVTDAFIDAQRESDSATHAAGHSRRNVRWSWSGESVLTDVHGAFAVKKLSPGTYVLRAYRKGGGEAIVEKVRLGDDVTLTIRATGTISGAFVASDGSPVERFTIAIRDAKAGFSRRENYFRTAGAFALRDLPAGDYHVAAEAPTGRAEADIHLDEGQTKRDVRLQMTANTTARGRVVAMDTGEPISGMVVSIQPAKGARDGVSYSSTGERKFITDAEGRYEVVNAPVGHVIVGAFPDFGSGSEYSRDVRVPATLQAGTTNELPPLRVPRNRVAFGQGQGDLGYDTQEMAPEADLQQTRWVVSVVRSGGPAAKAGLQVGDEITSVDGQDVVGPNGYIYRTLVRVPEKTSVTLGLRRGVAINIESRSRL
ncbi:carboxypeptidase regulatory-like domain-containing protein [Pendulispora brunnea]|uniref:Carboxypeptidase regulatory-like domain-containing protein n=1 Tax=Pendulispora brunnea TaxID=2905690 RepID=A0ABZ2KKB0_9BACT